MKSLMLIGLLSVPAFALVPVAPVNAAEAFEAAPKRVFIEASLTYNGRDPIRFTNPIYSGGRFEVKVLDVPVRYMVESTCSEGLCEEVWKQQEVGQTLAISPTVLADGKIQIETEFTDRQAIQNLRIVDTPAMSLASENKTEMLADGVKQTIVVLNPLRIRSDGVQGPGAELELTVKVEK